MPRLSSGVAALASVLLVGIVSPLSAQVTSAPAYAEYRADALVARGTSAEAGLGAVFPMGIYVRTSLDAAGGVTWLDGAARGSGRVDLISRFLLDPFRETPIGLSLGAGLSVPYVSGQHNVRPLMVAVIDIEGKRRGRITPALQIGLGGGTRIGVVLRTSPARWR